MQVNFLLLLAEALWAFATVELVSAALFFKKKNINFTEYSAQELVDRADPSRTCLKGHFCYPYCCI